MALSPPTPSAAEVAAAMAAADRTARKPATAPEPRGTLRRWEAADTDRLNQAHWENVSGQSINADLYSDLETLRTRSAYEAANNPIVAGVIRTHAIDVVGAHGPTLAVQSDNEVYNERFEAIWHDWWAHPTPRPDLAGPDLLQLWMRSLWTSGELLGQIITRDRPGPVQMAVKPIHARRLDTPSAMHGDPDVVMGVRLSKDGEPRQYYINEETQYGPYAVTSSEYRTLPPDLVLHGFEFSEEDQVRGAPWLASVLQVIADLRDYDAQVLDAARMAADFAVLLKTNHPDAQYIEVNESTEIERRTIRTVPPGWDPFAIQPNQPSTQYVEYRRERLADLGRPVSMPLMIVRLTAERHNYSSARMDAQLYHRAVQALQSWLERIVLGRLIAEVQREARFLVGPAPAGVKYTWTWQPMPHVDPEKEARAERTRLENGTLTWFEAIAAGGRDPEAVLEQLRRELALREEIRLPVLGTAAPSAAEGEAGSGGVGEEEEDNEENEELETAGVADDE